VLPVALAPKIALSQKGETLADGNFAASTSVMGRTC
jgi:hypothetical protein